MSLIQVKGNAFIEKVIEKGEVLYTPLFRTGKKYLIIGYSRNESAAKQLAKEYATAPVGHK